MMLRHSTLFPQPDSPTMASTSPSAREKDTSRTAWTSPAAVSKLTDKFFTSNNFAIESSYKRRNWGPENRPPFLRHILHFVMVHSVTFQKIPTPWWPMTVSGEIPSSPSAAT